MLTHRSLLGVTSFHYFAKKSNLNWNTYRQLPGEAVLMTNCPSRRKQSK
ncbi:hypothetical protein HMPREF9104_02055 [Lentilactobacillus kisonensis F0435]|uniref:Uncharacterized protein n=1 Tax=Lentilactobacillus kisonensis F0435 TaxID=797516 RepID=H1LHG4_9LACO|nr:hypothetical protein HMPREF9104_02055 [Lentilactobacillus kisonensis F0435]